MLGGKWYCKDGSQVEVYAMTTTHLVNILNLMHRTPGWRSEWKVRLEEELRNRKKL